MRPAAFVIIVYILFLLMQPCQDIFAAHALSPDEARTLEVSVGDLDAEAEEECSPFCICSCRTVPAAEYSTSFISQPKEITPIHRKNPVYYTNPQTKSFAATIWQPPKH